MVITNKTTFEISSESAALKDNIIGIKISDNSPPWKSSSPTPEENLRMKSWLN
jgi:hypothetical protein